jgi:UPF0271 protein
MRIDLNADLGEGAENDDALLQIVTSCSIACGGHAGDDGSMRRTLLAAKKAGVRTGAHPAYPDRDGFGRRSLTIEPGELSASLCEQMTRLKRHADDASQPLTHVKAHGALYNDAAVRPEIAGTVVAAARQILSGAAIIGLPGSCLETAAADQGAPFLAEGFVDRGYDADGSLIPRTEPGAMLSDPEAQAAQALALVRGVPFAARGGELTMRAATLCIHGDDPSALTTATLLRRAFGHEGLEVRAYDV